METLSKQLAWKNLIFRYLMVYLLATCADWLQGAYIYVLYHELGYTKYDIGVLFIAGFGSSAVFGSFIGGMADTKGRRLFVVVYGLAYALSCVTKRTYTCMPTICLFKESNSKAFFVYDFVMIFVFRFQNILGPHTGTCFGRHCHEFAIFHF